MKCKDCTDMICGHRTSDAEMECYYSQYAQPSSSLSKEQLISDTAVKLIASIPYEYVTSGAGGQALTRLEARKENQRLKDKLRRIKEIIEE